MGSTPGKSTRHTHIHPADPGADILFGLSR